MNRYLLINDGCGTCSTIGEQVQQEAGDVLEVRGLAELEIQQHLNTALPQGWKWEPMLLEVGQDIRVYSGVTMRLRMIQVLGVSRALRVANLVYKATRPHHPVENRRTFLRYGGGVVAGLAMLGLKSTRASAAQVLDLGGLSVGFTQLTGQKLKRAIVEATGHSDNNAYSSHLVNNGYTESQNTAKAYLIEKSGKTSVLVVNIPYSKASGETAMVRYFRHGQEITTTMGIVHMANGTFWKIDAYDVHNGAARHVTTYENEKGSIIEKPAGSPAQINNAPLNHNAPANSCNMCNQICALLRAGSCGGQASAACTALCLLFGPGAPACFPICFVLYVVICIWGLEEFCSAICIKWGFCG